MMTPVKNFDIVGADVINQLRAIDGLPKMKGLGGEITRPYGARVRLSHNVSVGGAVVSVDGARIDGVALQHAQIYVNSVCAGETSSSGDLRYSLSNANYDLNQQVLVRCSDNVTMTVRGVLT